MEGVLHRTRIQGLLHRVWFSNGSGSGCPATKASPLIRSCQSRILSSRGEDEAAKAASVRRQLEAAAREDRLDFLTAARILFSTPAKPKKFGLDFHLWQFFVACLPPFAVYLTAQYSRFEMRRMEKDRDVEQLKQQAALEEQLASKAAEDENMPVGFSTSASKPGIEHPLSQAVSGHESFVSIPEKDFLAMISRLDAMEGRVRNLESHNPETVSTVPPASATNPSKASEQKVESVQSGTSVEKPSELEAKTVNSSDNTQNDIQATGKSQLRLPI